MKRAALSVAWLVLATTAQAQTPDVARRLAQELRFEEALVEYQRFLARERPPPMERAQVLFEMGFLHALLGDDASAEQRAVEALELNPDLEAPPNASVKQLRFYERMKALVAQRVRIEPQPRLPDDPPELIRVRLVDAGAKVRTALVRHSVAPNGPYWSLRMECQKGSCSGAIPPLGGDRSYNVWYFVEAQDADGNVLARYKGPSEPLQIAIVRQAAWYKNPWVWGGTAATLLAVGAVMFIASPPPR